MKCDECLPAMELDGPARAQEALRHAASCPRCAADYAALVTVKEELAVHEPLSAAARAVWENASRIPVSEPARLPRWVPAMAGILTMAAACVAVVLLVHMRREVEVRLRIAEPPAAATAIIDHDPAVELDQLAVAVETLSGSLIALAEQADRLEMKREITLILNQYDRW